MKVAILSDIHGVLPALETVIESIDRWQPDHVIVNGDVVNRGPRPLECWEMVADRIVRDGWLMTVGNHEQFTVESDAPQPFLTPGETEMFYASRWTHQFFSPAQIDTMRELPLSISLTAPDGSLLRATHATLHGTRDGVMPWTSEEDLRVKIAPAPAVFATAHTHRAFVRSVDQTLVVNSGAVGMPLDNDKRASYAQIVWRNGWQAETVRLDYDRAAAQRDFDDTDFVHAAGASGPLMYIEWLRAESHFPTWYGTYWERVNSAEISAKEAVAHYLNTLTP
ncbi:MAG: metallophosphoesterase family protein [Candidatus Promineifilaceae bacterium]